MIVHSFAPSAQAQGKAQSRTGPGQLIVVFDGSGSMWGKIPGTDAHKFALMRDELVHHLRGRLAGLAIGLTTFGARSGGSCQSAETILAPATKQIDGFEQLLSKFNPQGRGPVVLGLNTAVDSIDPDLGPARLLLIHDSPDNCGQDLCALAAPLTKRGVVVDVISLAQKPRDKGSMSCLAKATGGTLIEAERASDAIDGLGRIVASLSLPEPQRIPETSAQPRAKPQRPKARPSSLRLAAKLVDSGQTINAGILWQVSSVDGKFDKSFSTPSVDVVLAPGRYRVRVNTTTWSTERIIDMSDGRPTAQTFTFDGGLLSVVDTGTSTGPHHGVVTITAVTSKGSLGQSLWTGPIRKAKTLLLPEGTYQVTHGEGLSRRQKRAAIDAGKRHEVSFGTNLARLLVKTEGLTPEQSTAAQITILADDPDEPGERIPIARTSATEATFDLPPGPYEIVLSAFGAESRRQIILVARQANTETLGLKQLALKVTSFIGTSKTSPSTDVRYRLWRGDALSKTFDATHEPQPTFRLAPGKYRIESHIGRQNAIVVREFDVGGTGKGHLDLHHRAGEIVFSLSDGTPLVKEDAYWTVSDRAGRLVWRGFAKAPSLTLAVGEYIATVDLGKSQYQTNFAVVNGPRQSVALDKM